jgi:hypothetical protein
LWPSSENLAAQKLVHSGCRKCWPCNTKEPKKKHLCRTSAAQWERNAFLSGIVTDDESWVHHYDPWMKRQWSGVSCHHMRHNPRCRLLWLKSWPMSCGTMKVSCYWNSWSEVL